MNTYNIFEQENESTILYHAIARDENHVRELAEDAGFQIEGLSIDPIRANIKDQMGRPYTPRIESALV